MNTMTSPRFDHLRRLTDSQGLLQVARGDVPDRFSGYDAIDNATALRLCAIGSQTVESDVSHLLTKKYFGFLSRGRRYDSGVRHHCDSTGGWTMQGDDALVQSYLARSLAAVIVSELPIRVRLAAADWWRMLLDEHASRVETPLAAANWLIAIGQLRAADPGRDLDRAECLAHWLLEDWYYPNRTNGWEWYDAQWTPLAATVPTALWYAYHCLGERRIFRVAQAMTQFVVDHLFRDGMLQPVGTQGTWSRNSNPPQYAQLPGEVYSIVELLCTAERISGTMSYGDYAELAARWFDGHNSKGAVMVDPSTGGCYNALTADGPDRNQSANAVLACLLTHAALAARPVRVEETIRSLRQEEYVYSDPSIGS
ncbi:MAG TPA: hypothetical protein PL151_02480 [Phycisphaerae bacterium]|nr:hypothetical protein [Phycisphaerae bacterium]HOQ85782.1 hypothetical protein [Phycisphaerae bacterium]HPP27147.1 hypothetical protein [Phycisphaerae bacterium]HPU27141.1 hypothetical protein [Phycisphaerae bacterium]HQE26600.1 hypothetical protein [Phycisphaerae bacterium]